MFPRLSERNVRQGFLTDAQYTRLAAECGAEGLWLRALLEVAYTYGWRIGELKAMRVSQVDLRTRTIRLEPGTTKNQDGRTVVMTDAVRELLANCVQGKTTNNYMFTRKDGSSVGDFRKLWAKVCIASGIGKMVCERCSEPVTGPKCERCDSARLKYVGLIVHDLRRTAARFRDRDRRPRLAERFPRRNYG
jgi:integrase